MAHLPHQLSKRLCLPASRHAYTTERREWWSLRSTPVWEVLLRWSTGLKYFYGYGRFRQSPRASAGRESMQGRVQPEYVELVLSARYEQRSDLIPYNE